MSEVEESGFTRPPLGEVTARVVATQTVFTAGHALTTGGYFNYFVNSYKPSTTWLAVLQAAPEFFETAGVLTRPVVMRVMSRKSLWMLGLIGGRLAALGIPLAAILGLGKTADEVLPWILAFVGVWYALQGLSYIAFLSWLSDLAPEREWSRFFAHRQLAYVATNWVVASIGGTAVRWSREHLPKDQQIWFYIVAFSIGGCLAMLSVLPMLRIPAVPEQAVLPRKEFLRPLLAAVKDTNFRWLLAWVTHMALAQGLTQAVLTKYQIEVLKLPLDRYLLMLAVMQGIQVLLSLCVGRLSDRFGDRNLLFVSHFAVAFAMVFPFLATAQHPNWQFGAYITWGLFGIVNVVMYTLAWRLAPRSDNTSFLGVFRPLSGLTAALAGIVGGIWLDGLLKSHFEWTLGGRIWTGFHVLFAVSLLGRITAPLWLLAIRERGASDETP